jgi:hypothetical protein
MQTTMPTSNPGDKCRQQLSQTDQEPPFFRLPMEIRSRIYRLVLEVPPIVVRVRKEKPKRERKQDPGKWTYRLVNSFFIPGKKGRRMLFHQRQR